MERLTNNQQIEKWRRGLRNAGNTAETIGWFTLVGSPFFYLIVRAEDPIKIVLELGPEFLKFGLKNVVLSMAIGFVLVILGRRIKTGPDLNSKKYLKILLGSSTCLLFFGASRGFGLLFLILIWIYSILALRTTSKLIQTEEYKSFLEKPKYKIQREQWILFLVIFVILFGLAWFVDRSHPPLELPPDIKLPERIR